MGAPNLAWFLQRRKIKGKSYLTRPFLSGLDISYSPALEMAVSGPPGLLQHLNSFSSLGIHSRLLTWTAIMHPWHLRWDIVLPRCLYLHPRHSGWHSCVFPEHHSLTMLPYLSLCTIIHCLVACFFIPKTDHSWEEFSGAQGMIHKWMDK